MRQVANLDGATGSAYGMRRGGERRDAIIEPATGRFIGERRVNETGANLVPAGTVSAYSSVTTAVVDGNRVPPPR